MFGFPWYSSHKDLCKTDIDEARVISFLGYRQTDMVLESSLGNMLAHKKFQLKDQN